MDSPGCFGIITYILFSARMVKVGKVKIICDPRKGGCGMPFEAELDKIKGEKFIQCPNCGRIAPNPFYEEES